MKNVTIIWRDWGDEFIITNAQIHEEAINNMTANDWVALAAREEMQGNGFSEEEITNGVIALLDDGYDLIAVCPQIEQFYY